MSLLRVERGSVVAAFDPLLDGRDYPDVVIGSKPTFVVQTTAP
jgi:hypothetical protein